ncbi:Membrane protein involved in the export of O-antigen and teichoic acid [Pseudoxanthomonas sp. GM95]|uniref:lipopolysaccharide biosynthesis protein n=1 Tax=Pseudoxanthomonas sp. GM95 TaxID=1881043 RepID=UPI0008D57663|nr:oligosaccharide flippase family protein [Pseudoxanthomonas sp. GM95]SEK52577.1 Membrane protein involved in the export of O-antigen and teichoic acid [Pseudoxanthomonas sp. GM95]
MTHSPSVRLNALANVLGQGVSTLVGIVFVPVYLQYLGAEAYGLVGFFVVLQLWLGLLDVGLSPMLNREVARARALPAGFDDFRRVLRSVELIFAGIALATGLAITLASPLLAAHWFKVQALDPAQVSQCVMLMGWMIGLRFFASIYRTALNGMEAQVSLNAINTVLALAKALGSLAVLVFVSPTPLAFFLFQLVLGVLEPLILARRCYRVFPPTATRIGLAFARQELRAALPFGLGVAYTSVLWMLLSQLDRLLLSGLLPLAQYGYFSLVTALSGAVMLAASPISNALIPRLTYLHSRGETEQLRRLFRHATQLTAVVMIPLTGMVAVFGRELMYAWTGDLAAATWAASILCWYMVGNTFLTFTSYQYYLQYAYGDLALNIRVSTLQAVIGTPLIVLAAYRFGAMGTAVVWCVLQALTFISYPPLVQRRLTPGLYRPWLQRDLLPVAVGAALMLALVVVLSRDAVMQLNRVEIFLALGAMGLCVMAGAAAGSSLLRSYLVRKPLPHA